MAENIWTMYNQNYIHPIQKSIPFDKGIAGTLLKLIKAMMTHSYRINGMTCNSCVASVKNLLEKVPGIKQAQISLESKTATLDMDHHVELEMVRQAFVAHPKYTIEEVQAVKQPLANFEDEDDRSFWETYKPIILVFGYILGVTVIAEMNDGSFGVMNWMRYFMAGFFIVFSFFKLLDLPSFAASYSSYDVIAKKWMTWGFIYPFAELALGILFLINYQVIFTNVATLLLMSVSSIGVIQSLMAKRKIKCACLGAVFNLPMSTITLIEDLLMVGMSAFMIIYHI